MKLSFAVMLRIALLALLLVAPAAARAQSFSWKAPEAVAPEKAYTVSVSCVEAATVVLLKNGVVVAVGTDKAAVTTTDATAQTATYTAHAYGGNVVDGAATSIRVVAILSDGQAKVQPTPVRDASSEADVSGPAVDLVPSESR